MRGTGDEMNDQELMRHWLWMQTMEYALSAVKSATKAHLYPIEKYHENKHIDWQTQQKNIFQYVLDNWNTTVNSGMYASHGRFNTGHHLEASPEGVKGEYKDMVVFIKWPEVRRFIQMMLSEAVKDKQLDLFELLAQEAMG